MTNDLTSLANDLHASDTASQAAAAEALARMGADAAPVAVELVRGCECDDETVRNWCIAALEKMGPPPAAQIPALLQLAKSSRTDIAYWAVTLLGRAGDEAADAVAPLADILAGNADIAVRERAVWALGRIGPTASPALDALRAVATGDEPRLSRLAQSAIDAIDA
jgi:HEAT repeat protein